MEGGRRRVLVRTLTAFCMLVALAGRPASASGGSDESAVSGLIAKWVVDFNKHDMKSFVAACTPRAAIVDGFPPYAWGTCADWIRDYEANNKAIEASHGVLSIGEPVYSEFKGDRAYVVYTATFTDTQGGQPVVYTGSWAITLQKTTEGWKITGSGSAWGTNDLP